MWEKRETIIYFKKKGTIFQESMAKRKPNKNGLTVVGGPLKDRKTNWTQPVLHIVRGGKEKEAAKRNRGKPEKPEKICRILLEVHCQCVLRKDHSKGPKIAAPR